MHSTPNTTAPAQDAIWHENIVFAKMTEKTKWHGPPGPEVDLAWEGLYRGTEIIVLTCQLYRLVTDPRYCSWRLCHT